MTFQDVFALINEFLTWISSYLGYIFTYGWGSFTFTVYPLLVIIIICFIIRFIKFYI